MTTGINSNYQSTYIPFDAKRAYNNQEDYCYLKADKTGKPLVSIHARRLVWDTEVLGIPCARIDSLWMESEDALPQLTHGLKQTLEKMDCDGIQFCDLRIGLHAFNLIHLAEKQGFLLMDVLNIYLSAKSPSALDPGNSEYNIIVPIVPTDDKVRQAVELGMHSFQYSRMQQDRKICAKNANRFYCRMMGNFLSNPNNYVGMALDADGNVAGFFVGCPDHDISVNGGIGYLWFIAVHEKHTRRSLGKQLLNHFLIGMHKRCALVEIGTQINNRAANSLYSNANLTIIANVASFHKWFP